VAAKEPTEILKIDSLSYGPYGIGRRDREVVLVPLTAPGDEAEVHIVEKRGNYALGELSRLIKPSPQRQEPPCPYFGKCGGCPWQHIQYDAQLAAKQKSLEDALRRIGKLSGFELLPILRPPQEYHYRHRIRLHPDDQKRLGFHRSFSHELIEIDACLIAHSRVDRYLSYAREWIRALRTALRHIEIVAGEKDQKAVLVGHAKGKFFPEDDAMSSRFLERNSDIQGLILAGRGWRRCWGQGKVPMTFEDGIRTEIDGDVFTQVNREANRQLIRELLQWGAFHKEDRVLELYSGAGNFTLPVARRCREVVAVEVDPRSVENGERNGQFNGLENIRWLRSDVSRAVTELRKKGEMFSQIVLDPPRSGAKRLEEDLASFEATKILYVSCNPPTLARDLAQLAKKGYRLARVLPVDLFPHTFHVEALAEMVL